MTLQVMVELIDPVSHAVSTFNFDTLVGLGKTLQGAEGQEKSPLAAAIHTKVILNTKSLKWFCM